MLNVVKLIGGSYKINLHQNPNQNGSQYHVKPRGKMDITERRATTIQEGV